MNKTEDCGGAGLRLDLGSPGHLQSPKTFENPFKVSMKSFEGCLGPPDAGPRESQKNVRKANRKSENQLFPDPPTLVFFWMSLRFVCFVSRFSLVFWCLFLLPFPRNLGLCEEEKPLLFWGFPLPLSKQARVGGSGFS